MYTLKQWLDAQPQPFLEGLAELWGIEIPTASHKRSVEILAEAMPKREAVSCALNGCSRAARDALAVIMGKGGMVTRSAFSYEHGRIRPMGPGALMREKPWRSPENVAEELWYRGFIVESTERISGVTAEVFVIPHELRPWIPVAELPRVLSLPEAAPPEDVRPSPWTLGVDMTLLLAFAYLRRLRLRWDERWHGRDRRDLAAMLGVEPDERKGKFAFLWKLAQEMGMLVVEPGSVVMLHRERSLRWLEISAARAQEGLWRAWLGSKRWNDLCEVPDLECSGGGWENDPEGTRRRFLKHLLRWTQPDRWYSLDQLVETFAEHEPDFQRPGGDYRSWNVRDRATGNLLLGREHWDEVEGRLIRFLLTGPMRWLGAVEVAEGEAGTLFRWTPRGDVLASGEQVREYPEGRIRMDGAALLVPWSASPRTVFRAARVADFVSREESGVMFRISADSLTHAHARGVSLDAVATFLSEASGITIDRDTLVSLVNGAHE